MKIKLELSEAELKKLIIEHFKRLLGEVEFDEKRLLIETKSKQNYRAEWEKADFRAAYEHYET